MESEKNSLENLKRAIYQDKVYGALNVLRSRSELPAAPLNLSELRVFSQNGEDGVLFDLVARLQPPEIFVGVGGGDGWSSNTRLWSEVFGWAGALFEADPIVFKELEVRNAHLDSVVTKLAEVGPANINDLLVEAKIPEEFGILDIDIDGQDYWVWEALETRWKPSIVVCEINSDFGNTRKIVEAFDNGVTEMTATWGASLRAVQSLAARKGYDLVYVYLAGVNAFFLRSDLNPGYEFLIDRSPNYGLRGLPHPAEVLHHLGGSISRPTVDL